MKYTTVNILVVNWFKIENTVSQNVQNLPED